MATIDTSLIQKQKQTPLYVSIFFTLIVILITGFLSFITLKSERYISETSSTILSLQSSIDERLNDPLIETYQNYQRQKDIFDTLAYRSQIPTFVQHLKRNFLRQWLDAKWFSYRDGKISLPVEWRTDERWFWFEKVEKFLHEYPLRADRLLSIEPVTLFSWHDTIRFIFNWELLDEKIVNSNIEQEKLEKEALQENVWQEWESTSNDLNNVSPDENN